MLEELERVRAYRADVPEPDAAVVAAARTELMRAIAMAPAREAPREAPRAAAHETGPTEARRQGARMQGARLRRLQRRRRFVLAGGLAAAGLAVAGVLGLGGASAPPSALAAEMNQLAQVAASQDWIGIPGPGEYLYTSSEGPDSTDTIANGRECTVTYFQRRQSWIATDGSGALAETNDNPHFTSAADQATCATMGITDPSTQDAPSTDRFAAGGLSFPTNNWKSLSTDPQTLLKQIHQIDGGPNDSGELMTNINDFLRESDAPPIIRATLYKAAALIPGVRLLGLQTDPTGQKGLGVGYYSNGALESEMIVNQQTAQLVAEEAFDPATGKLVGWTTYQPSKIVNSVPDYPLEGSQSKSSNPSGVSTAPAGSAGS